jgi:putative membrane protein
MTTNVVARPLAIDTLSPTNNHKEEKTMKEEKVRMGMERTYLGWIRTGLMLLGFGVIATEDVIDLEPEWFWWAAGLLFVITGTIILFYSFWEFYINLRKQQQGSDEEIQGVPVWLMGLISVLLIAGALLILVLAFL